MGVNGVTVLVHTGDMDTTALGDRLTDIDSVVIDRCGLGGEAGSLHPEVGP